MDCWKRPAGEVDGSPQKAEGENRWSKDAKERGKYEKK